MLVEKVRKLRDTINASQGQQASVDRAARFKTRIDQIAEPGRQLATMAQLVQLFRRHGVVVPLDTAKLISFSQNARDILERFKRDPESILSTSELRFRFWEPIEELPAEIRQSLTKAWDNYVDEKLPARSTELVQILGRMPGFEEQLRAVENLYREASELHNELPTGEADLIRIREIGDDLRSKWASIRGEGLSDVVLQFLRAASTGEATLTALTTEVRGWLQDHDLLDALRIVLKTSDGIRQ